MSLFAFRFRARSFRFYLTTALALTALVPLLILALLQQQQLRGAAAQADARQLELAQLLADDIAAYVATSRQLIELAAERLHASHAPSRADLDRLLAGTFDLFPGFLSLHYDDARGQTLAFYPQHNERGESMLDVDHRDRWHFVELQQRPRRSVISEVFKARGATERQIVSLASPAYDQSGRLLGYAAAGLDLGHLAGIVRSRIGEGGLVATVADPAGNAMYAPSLDLEARPVSAIPALVLDRLRQGEKGFLQQQARPGEPESLTAYVAIPELGWIVGLSQSMPLRNAAADQAARTSGLLLLVVAMLTVVAGSLAARPLARAVGRLLNQVESLTGSGTPATDAAGEIEGPLELVRLQQSFRQMAADVTRSRAKLLELNQALEGQVAERTATLSARNEELRTLHGLLMPIAPAGMAPAIDQALQAYARLLDLDAIEFTAAAAGGLAMPGAVVVALQNKSLGFIGTRPALPGSGEKRDSLARLADSVAIVLNNQALYAELGQQHATLTAVFESMNEGLLLITAQGVLLYANPMAQRLLGVPDSGATGPVQAVFAAAFTNEAAGELELDLLQLGATPCRLLRRGTRQTIDALGFAVAGGTAGEPQRGILLRDVTREVQIERLKESLISVVAHELKTPIAAMRIQVETLARADAEWSAAFRADLLRDMLSESLHLQHLIDDWLDITRIEGGLLRLERKVVQVAGLLDRAGRVVGAQYDITVTRRIARNAECCHVDAGRVTQLLINLLSNAARYSRGPAQVAIEVRRDGGWVEIVVADHGIGIPPDQLERVFDRFYQVDMSMSRRTGGTGLGLAICRGIAEAHGGSIVADSVLGQGTRFIVRLPY